MLSRLLPVASPVEMLNHLFPVAPTTATILLVTWGCVANLWSRTGPPPASTDEA
ncbi:MAG TPA: hypothetical protein VNZ52_04445 [Candidatus Thermoplasmatota archaeon]|nr:hypothetical protein [Candidatus Thermoplasmatota archaeon]